MLFQAQRWLPDRTLVLVADSSFAALELLSAVAQQGVIAITRLRLDAALYEPLHRVGREHTAGHARKDNVCRAWSIF